MDGGGDRWRGDRRRGVASASPAPREGNGWHLAVTHDLHRLAADVFRSFLLIALAHLTHPTASHRHGKEERS